MFGKFMNKKFFHPGSYPNVKMRWIHEQRDAAKKKSEEEKQATYQKEQESYQSRMLSAKSNEEKMKLDLNFLYDLPPGMKNDDNKEEEEDKEREVKFEWQKHAPRSKYINDLGLECADQPFGVCVRNIRCFKCRAWGHQNTDRECPLFFSNVNSEAEGNIEGKSNLRLSDPLLLLGVMKEQHGLALKKSVIGKEIDPMAENQQLIVSDEDDDELGNADLKFVESLTNKQKRRLLKRLNKLEKNERKRMKRKKNAKRSDKMNYCSSTEDDVKSYKRQKLSGSEDDVNKTEYDSKIYKEQENEDNKNVEDKSKLAKKHKISASKYSMDKCNEFDFKIHKKLKNSISQNDDESSGSDSCYKKRKSSTNKDNKNINANYYKKGKNSNSEDNESSENDYENNKQWKSCTNEDTHFRHEQQGVSNHKDRNYSKSHNENYRKHCKTVGKESNESDNNKRKSTCKLYDEIDEKLHQIRNGIVNKGKIN